MRKGRIVETMKHGEAEARRIQSAMGHRRLGMGLVCSLTVATLLATPALVQSGGEITIRSSAITAGGVSSAGGDFSAVSTSGQPAVGVMTGGEFSMSGGIVAVVSCGVCQLYGDPYPTGGNCLVDLDDIFCVLDGFAESADCPAADLHPCGGNSIIDLDDIFAVLDAFAAYYACPHPCPPQGS